MSRSGKRADKALTDDGDHRYTVDFRALRWGKVGAMLRNEQVQVDPHLISEALCAVMRRCTVRDARGDALVWNEYKIFLARADHSRLRPLETRLHGDLPGLLHEQLLEQKADLVGDLCVRLMVDEAGDVEESNAIVLVGFVPNKDLASSSDDEVTVRVNKQGRRVAEAANTQRIEEPASGDGVHIVMAQGRRFLPAGTRVMIGRPHPNAPPNFLALAGADKTINKRQLWLEADEHGVIVGRMSNANPVQVNGRLVQPGGELLVEALPVELSLSNGGITLQLERPPDP